MAELIYSELPESPVRGYESIERRFGARKGEGGLVIALYAEGQKYPDGYFSRRNCRVTSSPGYDLVSITFTAAKPEKADREVGETVVSKDNSTSERPIEDHSDYLTNWNYDLFQYVPTGEAFLPAVPAWWATATDRSDGDGVTYYWAKELPAADAAGKWYKIAERTNGKQESFIYPFPVYTQRKYYETEEEADAALLISGKLKAPARTAPFQSGDQYWLVDRVFVERQERYWTAVSEHLYAEWGWRNYQVAP